MGQLGDVSVEELRAKIGRLAEKTGRKLAEPLPEPEPPARRGRQPWGGASGVSRHDHVGSMWYRDGSCGCSSCGQEWWLKLSDGGAPIMWVPLQRKGG